MTDENFAEEAPRTGLATSSTCLCDHHADRHFRNSESCITRGCDCTEFVDGGPRIWPTDRIAVVFKTLRDQTYVVLAGSDEIAQRLADESPDKLVSIVPVYAGAGMRLRGGRP